MTESDPRTIDWTEREFGEVRPGIFGSTVHTPQLTATMYRYAAGSSWEEHEHPQDQITTVIEGSIDFVVAGQPSYVYSTMYGFSTPSTPTSNGTHAKLIPGSPLPEFHLNPNSPILH